MLHHSHNIEIMSNGFLGLLALIILVGAALMFKK